MADDPGRSRKFHEGWLYIKVKGDWTKYWAVLRGHTVYFFHSNKTTEQNHVGTLYLDGQTEVRSLPPDGMRKKTYKFELYTHHPVRKCNRFKFNNENDRDVWKCYIMAVATGIVPRDVKILPGQLKDVVEAIGEVMKTPPPLPTLPRPRINNNNFQRQFSSKGSERSFGSGGSEESDRSGSFDSHITMKRNRSQSVPRLLDGNMSPEPDEEVPNLRSVLGRRQSELALKSLGRERPRSPVSGFDRYSDVSDEYGGSGGGGGGGGGGDGGGNVMQWSEFSIGKPPPRSTTRSHTPGMFSQLEELEWGRPDSPPIPPSIESAQRPSSPPPPPRSPPPTDTYRPSSPPPRPLSPTFGGGDRTSRKAPPPRQFSDYGSTSSEVHQFFMDSSRNRDHPPWFFENTSRELAESILTLGKRYGNVLMRESVTFKNTGSYVISMRREVAGYDPRTGQHFSRGTQLNHYEVQKGPQGFKINVDNDHRPMRCLNEVMQFFVRQAGPGTSPMNTNNMAKLGLNVNAGRRGQGTDDADSGLEDDDHNSVGARSDHSSPPAPPPIPRLGRSPAQPGKMNLNISGAVPGDIHQAALYMDNKMKKKIPEFDESRMSMPPAPPPPPPPPGGMGSPPPPPPPTDFGTARPGGFDARSRGAGPPPEGGFSDPNLNRTVPPRMPPTETLQRTAGGYQEQYYNSHKANRQHDVYGSDSFDTHSSIAGGSSIGGGGGPPPPPPPPPPDMGGGPPPPPPMEFNTPPPPPPPAPPGTLQAMLQSATLQPAGNNQGRRMSDTSSQVSGFMTTPNRGAGGGGASKAGGGGGGGGGGNLFEEELKKRLMAQREEVYSSGATILKSANWGT